MPPGTPRCPATSRRTPELGAAFTTTVELQERFASAVSLREQLRAGMVARQEEMDWLVYAAYGLLPADHPAAQVEAEPAPLDQAQRPFRFWESAEGDFAKAVALIPADWPKLRRALWEARLAAIRDNEHIRRIEQPVYKRRWDEQWKVGNRWMAGPGRLRAGVPRRLPLVAVRESRVVA